MSKYIFLFVCCLSACFQTRWVETTPKEFKSASNSDSHVEQYRPEIKAHIDQVNGFSDSIVWLTSDWRLVRHERSGALLRRVLKFEFAGMTSTGTCLVGVGRFSQERIAKTGQHLSLTTTCSLPMMNTGDFPISLATTTALDSACSR